MGIGFAGQYCLAPRLQTDEIGERFVNCRDPQSHQSCAETGYSWCWTDSPFWTPRSRSGTSQGSIECLWSLMAAVASFDRGDDRVVSKVRLLEQRALKDFPCSQRTMSPQVTAAPRLES